MTFYYSYIFKNIGRLTIVEEKGKLSAVLLHGGTPFGTRRETPLILRAKTQLEEYFAGTRKVFDLPCNARGTEFQKRVWEELSRIPYGKTLSYGEVAKNVANARASRAVGSACNKNPLCIIVPCHRVIGSNGRLVGYAHGIALKQQLLELEKRNCIQ